MSSTTIDDQDPFIRNWIGGHRNGYLDAIAELWDLSHEQREADKQAAATILVEAAAELRRRYDGVRSRNLAFDKT